MAYDGSRPAGIANGEWYDSNFSSIFFYFRVLSLRPVRADNQYARKKAMKAIAKDAISMPQPDGVTLTAVGNAVPFGHTNSAGGMCVTTVRQKIRLDLPRVEAGEPPIGGVLLKRNPGWPSGQHLRDGHLFNGPLRPTPVRWAVHIRTTAA